MGWNDGGKRRRGSRSKRINSRGRKKNGGEKVVEGEREGEKKRFRTMITFQKEQKDRPRTEVLGKLSWKGI